MAEHLSLEGVARLVALLGERPVDQPGDVVFTLEEVAAMTKMALRPLILDVRAGKFEHVRRGDLRGMTREQINKLVQAHVSGGTPASGDGPEDDLQKARDASRRSGGSRRGRVPA